MREMCARTGGAWLPIGSERTIFSGGSAGRITTDFEVSKKERSSIPTFGQYIAERVMKPYLLQLEVSPQASGKLRVQVISNSAVQDKKPDVVVADRLPELAP